MKEICGTGLRSIVCLLLSSPLVISQGSETAGCVPEGRIEVSTSRKATGATPEAPGRGWRAQNTTVVDSGDWEDSMSSRFTPQAGTNDAGSVMNTETIVDWASGEPGPASGGQRGQLKLHAKSLAYAWAEDGDSKDVSAIAEATGSVTLTTICQELPGHHAPPNGETHFLVTNQADGFYRVHARSAIRKAGSLQLAITRPWGEPVLEWRYFLHDTAVERWRESVGSSAGVEANLGGQSGTAGMTTRESTTHELGINARTSHRRDVEISPGGAIAESGRLQWLPSEVIVSIPCHDFERSASGRVSTNAQISVTSFANSDEQFAAGEIWGTLVTRIVASPFKSCAVDGTSGGGSTGGGGGATGGGAGSGTTPPSGGGEGPVAPPSGGRTTSEETGGESPTLAAGCSGFAYSQGATMTPTRTFERWAPFVVRVNGAQDGEALSAPLHCRVAPGQSGVTLAGTAYAEQIQVGLPAATLELPPIGPFRFGPGIWVLSLPYTGGSPGWVFFEASFDPGFPDGNTAKVAIELVGQPFTLAELSIGAHQWTNVDRRLVVRSAGPLPDSIPVLLVDREFDSSTLAVSWSQLSGTGVEWESPPRIVLAPAGEARASIVYKAVLPRDTSAEVLMTLSSPGHSLDFVLDLGN